MKMLKEKRTWKFGCAVLEYRNSSRVGSLYREVGRLGR